jgi:hypothetical protein
VQLGSKDWQVTTVQLDRKDWQETTVQQVQLSSKDW